MTNLFKVDGQTLTPVEIYPAVSDTVNYLTFAFMFSYDWAGLTKSAIFTKGTDVYEVVLTNDEVLESDHVNLSAGVWSISVVGDTVVDAVVTRQITTSSYDYTVAQSGATSGGVFPPSIASQVYVNVNQATPQTFVGGIPKLASDRVIDHDNEITDKKFVIDAVATVTADNFNHNDLSNKQGGSAGEYYHITQAQNAALHAHSNKAALDAVSGTNTGDQTLPTRDSLGLDTDDTVTFANLSGTNTGDQNAAGVANTPAGNIAATTVQAAINELDSEKEAVANKVTSISSSSTDVQYPSAKAAYSLVSPLITNHNWLYDGRDLSTIFTAAQFIAAVRADDWSNIRIGDYWPITLNGTFRDYGYYTCPASTNYYSDTGLTTLVGQTSTSYQATYVNSTYCSISISSTTYYVSTAACTAYYGRSLSNAVVKMEVAGISPYSDFGDTGLTAPHVALIGRDCLPFSTRMRLANTVWTDGDATNPWKGSALYKTLNEPTYGILPIVAATDIGAYIYTGSSSLGMSIPIESKASGATTSTSAVWDRRGQLFVPKEGEVTYSTDFAEKFATIGLTFMPLFANSTKHRVKRLGNGSSITYYWTMSSGRASATTFVIVEPSGTSYSFSASGAFAVPLCFIVA